MSVKLKEPRVVYKKAYSVRDGRPVVLTLLLPVGTLVRKDIDRCHKAGLGMGMDARKNRASQALVVDAMYAERDGGTVRHAFMLTEFRSSHDPTFTYEIDKLAVPHKFSKNAQVCASGIHFFKSLDDAIRYF